METVRVLNGKKFIQKGDRQKALYVLLQGKIKGGYRTYEWDLEPGSIIGILESASENYICEYTACEDCILYAYDYAQPEDYRTIFAADEKYVSVFMMSAMRQASYFLKRYENYYKLAQNYHGFFMRLYQEYQKFCQDYDIAEKSFPRIDSAKPFVSLERINTCMIQYYNKMAGMSMQTLDAFLKRDFDLGIGEILNGTGWMIKALNLIEEIREYLRVQKELLFGAAGNDLFHYYFELIKKAAKDGADIQPLQDIISELMDFARTSGLYHENALTLEFEAYENYDFQIPDLEDTPVWDEDGDEEGAIESKAVTGDYLDQIFRYADYEEEKAADFKEALHKYKNLPDRLSTADDVRILRKKLTAGYYEIYKKVFRQSLERYSIPPVIKMFLNFGFMDSEIVGEETADSLYDLTDELFLCKADNVYTIFEWLRSIYQGENEPSRNEFDMDYTSYVHEQKKTGKISEQQEKQLLEDGWSKVEFEMDNMFVSNNRATYGKFSVFCPVLCEDDIINSVENMLVTAEKINGAIDEIRNIDFSIFYRQVVFSDPAKDINREMIQKEVLPNVILMPNAGSRAMMWQETAGIRRDTPARFVLPILTVADVTEMIIEVAGRFRWEICRKIQGVRWNDITDPSLTSEYSDYIQYYRKNHELSADAREKVKNALYKAKNNFREVFVKDYQSWIKYESKGSFRLNKVAREIIFRYCPFAKSIRQDLKINPMYQDLFSKYDIFNERDTRRIDLLYERYQKKGGEITKELQDSRDFYDM